jgi:hypothetical protein
MSNREPRTTTSASWRLCARSTRSSTVPEAGARYASAKQTRHHGDHKPAAGRPAGARVRSDATVRGGRVGTGRGPHLGQTQQALQRSGRR